MLAFMMGYGFSVWDLLLIPGLLLGLYARARLSSSYRRYSQVPAESGLSGAQAARQILDSAGLRGMPVYETPGELTDHYDPTKKALFLSAENFHGRSLAALGVAAHEAGHALQHKAAYAPLHLRMALVPVATFASNGAMIAFMIGMVIAGGRGAAGGWGSTLMGIGIALFTAMTFFQLVTLPVEFDASSRAKKQLVGLGLITPHELPAVSNVLGAAALTYVAALASAVFELLRLIMISRSFSSRDER